LSQDAAIYAGSTDEIEAALDDSALFALLAAWAGGDDEYEKLMAFELKLIMFFGPENSTGHRRTNPKARSMRRHGKKYQVRQDHGTAATRKGANKVGWKARRKSESYRTNRDTLRSDPGMSVIDAMCPDCYGPQYTSEVGDYDILCTPGYCGTRHGTWV
jgi:hypothetical protein